MSIPTQLFVLLSIYLPSLSYCILQIDDHLLDNIFAHLVKWLFYSDLLLFLLFPCTIMGTSVSWASACSNMLVCEVLTTFNDHDDDNDYGFDDGDEMV